MRILRHKLQHTHPTSANFKAHRWGIISSPIARMVETWQRYAIHHAAQFDSLIGDDGVLGREWQDMGDCLIGLLNGPLGGCDGGSLDSAIREIAKTHGVTEGELVA